MRRATRKKTYSDVEKVLKNNPDCMAHFFRSGGGLRVGSIVRKKDKSEKRAAKAYGESCHFHEAMRIMDDDAKVGGRIYKAVFGVKELHYLTGAYPDPSTPYHAIDTFLCSGLTIDMFWSDKDEVFVLQANDWIHVDVPNDVKELAKQGRFVVWELSDGTVFQSYCEIFNGQLGFTTSCLKKDVNGEDYHKHVKHTFTGKTLVEAMDSFVLYKASDILTHKIVSF